MIDGQNISNQPVKNILRTYDNIPKISSGQGGGYTGSLLDYSYFKEYYKMIATDLSKQQAHLRLIRKQYSKLILLEI